MRTRVTFMTQLKREGVQYGLERLQFLPKLANPVIILTLHEILAGMTIQKKPERSKREGERERD